MNLIRSCILMVFVLSTPATALTITLEPLNPPIIIPASGGSFDFQITIENTDTLVVTFDSWLMIQLPDQSWYGPVMGPVSLTLSLGESITRPCTQAVPGSAPLGMYTVKGCLGSYPDSIWFQDSFPFSKLSGSLPDTLWTQTYGGSDGDLGFSVRQTSDSGYIIAGWTSSFGAGSNDVYLIKTDELGNEIWARTFGGIWSDSGNEVQQTSDGGYIIVGSTASYGLGNHDVLLIKTDEMGYEVWSQRYGGLNHDFGYSVKQTSDGGFIVVGVTASYGEVNGDVFLIKTDEFGDVVWSQTFGGDSGDWGLYVQQTTDGGYIITGKSFSYGAGSGDVYLIRTDRFGNEVWSQTFGGSEYDCGHCVQQAFDGGYVVAGKTQSYGLGSADFYLLKTDMSGELQWENTFGGSSLDHCCSLHETSDRGFILAGHSYSFSAIYSDIYLIRTDDSGNGIWSQTLGGNSYDFAESVQQVLDGGFIIAGWTNSYGAGEADVYLIRLEPETATNLLFSVPQATEVPVRPSKLVSHQFYPNPFNPTTTIGFTLPAAGPIHLAIYDLSGRKVADLVDGWRDAGYHQVTFDGKGLTSGVYLYILRAGEFHANGKLVYMK